MAAQKGADNWDWMEAFFKQSCFDFFNGKAVLFASSMPCAGALALAQFQQCAEKAVKAAVFLETKKRLGVNDTEWKTHSPWVDVVVREIHLRALRSSIVEAIAPWPESKIAELEKFAPHGVNDAKNTEYPWIEAGTVRVPAVEIDKNGDGSGRELHIYKGIAEAILLCVAHYSPKLSRVLQSVQAQTGALDLR